jgi:hypothetical protein
MKTITTESSNYQKKEPEYATGKCLTKLLYPAG